jgi:SsrA-binding protein
MKQDEYQSVARNKKAWHDYTILDKLEVGIQLKGCEVKSIREARVTIGDAYVRVENGELYLLNAHITPYSKINSFEALNPIRKRKLLAHKAQIKRLIGQSERKGYAIIPLSIYFNERGKAKCQIALATGKKQYDKRDSIKKKMHDRDMQRAMKSRQR